MIKTKKLIICIISIIALILAITTNAFAIDSTYDDIVNALGNQNPENEFEQIGERPGNTEPTNTVPSNTEPTNTVPNNTVNENIYNNTTNTMPNTGVSYSSIVIIAICIISAAYAHKKIREYNV